MLSLQRAKARKVEVKLGIAYEGWNKIGKDRYQTIHKMFYADIASSDAFWTGMTFKLHGNYALANIKDSIVGGDGGTGIKDGVDYFNGKFKLCRYHLNREIRHKLGSDKETIRSLQESINKEDMNTLYGTINEAASRAKEIKRLYRYIRANVFGLKDYRHAITGDYNLIRTGPIEGNIDKLIVRHMKNQGMSWTHKGIRRMLGVRLLLREGKLIDWLDLRNVNTEKHGSTPKRIKKQKYFDWFSAGVPALYGPHASRSWVKLLKSLAEAGI